MTRRFASDLDLPYPPAGYEHFSEYDTATKQCVHYKTHRPLVPPDDVVRYGEDCALSVLRRLWPCPDCDARGYMGVQVGYSYETGPEYELQDCEACGGLGYDERAMPDGFPDKLMPTKATQQPDPTR